MTNNYKRIHKGDLYFIYYCHLYVPVSKLTIYLLLRQ